MLAATAPLWITARAAGIGALLSASGALSAGLLMALGPLRLKTRKLELRATHEALAIGTVVLIALHAVSLFFDATLAPGVAGILLPFGASYRTFGTALGQLAAYGMIALGLTFYVRRRLGGDRWRRAHRWIPVFWLLAIGHALLTGTDTTAWWCLIALAGPVLAGATLLVLRHAAPAAPPRPPASPAPRRPARAARPERAPAHR